MPMQPAFRTDSGFLSFGIKFFYGQELVLRKEYGAVRCNIRGFFLSYVCSLVVRKVEAEHFVCFSTISFSLKMGSKPKNIVLALGYRQEDIDDSTNSRDVDENVTKDVTKKKTGRQEAKTE